MARSAALPASPSAGWWRPERDRATARPRPAAASAPSLAGRVAFAALAAFTVVLVIAPQDFIAGLDVLRPARLTAGLAILAYLADRWSRGAPAGPTPRAFVLAALLVGWAFVMVPLSLWPGGSMSTLTELFLKAVAVFWLLGSVVTTTARLRTMFWVQTICTIPLALTAVAHYRSGAPAGADGRIDGYGHGLAGNPNDLALVLALSVPLAAALAGTARRWPARAVAATILVLQVAGIMATFSRGGVVVLAVVALSGFVWLCRQRRLGAATAVVVAGLLAWSAAPDALVDRVGTLSDFESDPTGSAQERWRDTVAAARYTVEHPIVGAGPGMDVLALNEVRGATWRTVHNAYLNYGVDLGLPGLVLFVLLLATCLRAARRVERRAGGGQLAGLAGGLRIALWAFAVGALFYPVAYHFYFYWLAGLAVAASRIDGRRARPAALRPERAA